MGKVVANTTATLHELHLFLVYSHNGSIGISIAVKSDNKTIAE